MIFDDDGTCLNCQQLEDQVAALEDEVREAGREIRDLTAELRDISMIAGRDW